MADTVGFTRRLSAAFAMTESGASPPVPNSQLLDYLPAAVYVTDAHGRILSYNRAATELWGRQPEIGKELWCGSHRILRKDGTPMELDECPMAVALREGRPVHGVEIIVERPDGTRVNVLPHPEPIFGTSGVLVGAVNLLVDITDLRDAQDARGLLSAIVSSSDDAIVSKTLDGRITSWNAGAERIFGYTSEEAVGQPITMLIPPDRHGEEVEILNRLRRGERIDHFESVRRTKNGRLIDVSLTVSPVRNGQGRIIGASKIARDITSQKREQAALREARDAAESANRAKDRFFAMLSHELR